MYKYVEDKQFLSRMRSLCGEIMQDLCHTLKEEYDIGASFYLVGSGARNLILQNATTMYLWVKYATASRVYIHLVAKAVRIESEMG